MHTAFFKFLGATFGDRVLDEVHGLVEDVAQDAAHHEGSLLSPRLDVIMLERAIKAAADVLDVDNEQLQLQFGSFLVPWILESRGFEKLLRCMSDSFFGFLRCLNNLLLHLSIDMPGFAAIECHVQEVSPASLLLCCSSSSSQRMPCSWLKGFLDRVADQVFDVHVSIEHSGGTFTLAQAGSTDSGASQRQVYSVSLVPSASSGPSSTTSAAAAGAEAEAAAAEAAPLMGLGPERFYELFPFHFVLDSELRVMQAGSGYRKLIPKLATPGVRVQDVLQICHPQLPWSLHSLSQIQGTSTKLILSTSDGLELQGGIFQARSIQRLDDSSLKEGDDMLMFLGSPFHCCLDELKGHKMFISDYPSHDATAELVLMAEQNIVDSDRVQQSNNQLKELVEAVAGADDRSVGELGAGSAGELLLRLLDQLLVGEEVLLPQVLSARRALMRAGNNVWETLDVTLEGNSEATLALRTMLGLPHEDGAYTAAAMLHPPPPQLLLLPQRSSCTDVGGASYVPASGRGSRNSHLSDLQGSSASGAMLRTSSLGQPASGAEFRKKSRDLQQVSAVAGAGASPGFSTILEMRDPSVTLGSPLPLGGRGSRSPHTSAGAADLVPCDRSRRLTFTERLKHFLLCSSFLPEGDQGQTLQLPGSVYRSAAAPPPAPPPGQHQHQQQQQQEHRLHLGAAPLPSSAHAPDKAAAAAAAGEPPHKTSTGARSGLASSGVSQSTLSQRSSASRLRAMFGPLSISTSGLLSEEPDPAPATMMVTTGEASFGAALTPRARASWMRHRRPSQTSQRPDHSARSSMTKTLHQTRRRVSETWVVSLLAPPTDQLARALAGVDDWQFDAFQLEEASGGRPLSSLAFHLMKRMDIIKRMNINETRLARFLLRIEEGYLPDLYHCKAHAADVLRSLHVLLTRGDVLKGVLSSGRALEHPDHAEQREPEGPTEDAAFLTKLLFCYLSAIIHDFEHKGKNNDFLIRTGDRLALLYNDVSPAENHHLAAAFMLMTEEQFAFLPPNDKQVKDSMRKFLIEMVLATDMKQHFSLCGIFNSKVLATRGAATTAAVVRGSDRGSGAAEMPAATHLLVGRLPATDAPAHNAAAAQTPEFGRLSVFCRRSVRAGGGAATAPHPVERPHPGSGGVSRVDGSPALPAAAAGPGGRRHDGAPSPGGAQDCCQSFARRSMQVEQGHGGAAAAVPRPRSTLSPVGSASTSVSESAAASSSALPFTRQSHFVHSSFRTCSLQQAESSTLSQDLGLSTPQWDTDTQMLVLKMALKCADLGHLASGKDVHLHWVRRLEEEMFRQGDVEHSLGQAVSPLMDRTKGGITKAGAQPGFFNVVALPLFQSFSQVFPGAQPLVNNAKSNLELWNQPEGQAR